MRRTWRRVRARAASGAAIVAVGVVCWHLGVWSVAQDMVDGSRAASISAPIRLEGKQIPLPPGEWIVLARSTGEEALATLVLARVRDNAIDAAVVAHAGKPGRPVAWGLPTECVSGAFAPARVRYVSDHDGACAYAAFADSAGATVAARTEPAWNRALRAAVDRGWNLPETWYSAVFRTHDPMDGMQIRYLFHPWPIAEAKPPVSAAWRRVQAARLERWIDSAAVPMALAFRDRGRTRAEIALAEPEAAPDSPALSDAGSGYAPRALTARAATGAAEFAATWLFLGNAATATALTALRVASAGASALTHDWAWGAFAGVAPPMEVPGVGAETPLPR